ncbi:piggyBac transposable element-derived protein 3-like [Homalodisca vitripennis]|uniref:piggyBac transposable element-derived protein 3-like n=1 Tax=Homalodisca vitripennis TaxID=197043 RepID=UPI001EEADFC8|nr:piggyBac transposable element-derived protein 3-like [Homalodisca vitripennis]
MASTSHMTIEEILLLLGDLEESEANVASANVVVLPPQNVDCLTDEEQFNDDNTEDVDISEVCDNAMLNDETKCDRGFKVRPLLEKIQQSFAKFGVFEDKLAVEMIIKYFGRNNLKQFIRGKPVRFGYKFWALCGTSGYCYNFDLYCGKDQGCEENIGLGRRVVQSLLFVVDDPLSYELYFNNFFTSIELLGELFDLGFRASGTIRENRTQKCPLPDKKEMNKLGRGGYDYTSDLDSGIMLTRWNDNNIVTVATNFDSVCEPLANVTRYSEQNRGTYEDIESATGPTSRLHHNVPTTESADFSPTYQ